MYCNIADAYDQPYYDAQGTSHFTKQRDDSKTQPTTFNLKQENQMEFIDNKKYVDSKNYLVNSVDHDYYVSAFINNPLDQYFYRHLCECGICKHKLRYYRSLPISENISEGFSDTFFGYSITAKELCIILIICFVAIFIIDVIAKLAHN